MACYYPLDGWRSKVPGVNGKRAITFNPSEGYTDLPLQVPCGQCVGCRLEKSRQWALRCMHEASLHEDNCFLTLTYNDENLPQYNSLQLRDFQLFMKRLRKQYGSGIRFFHCGEYGEKNGRPHYHAIVFNFDFPDKELLTVRNDHRLYRSDALDSLWGLGFCSIGDVTFDSAAYVARYCLKKMVGKGSDQYYERVDPETGEVVLIAKEYATMSRRPGIGHGWYERYRDETYPSDFVVRDGVKMRPPKAYDRRLEAEDPRLFNRVRGARVRQAAKHADNNTPARLKVREKVQKARLQMLPRRLDDDGSS